MLDYTDLKFTPELTEMIEEQAFNTDTDVILFLEQYKFYSREELITFLNTQLSEHYVNIAYVQRKREYSHLETRYGIIISEVESDAVEIISPLGNKADSSVLELQLGNATISDLYVTPLNYYELCKQKPPELEPVTLFKRILLEAVGLGATDIHFDVKHEDTMPSYTVSIRKNGDICDFNLFELDANLNKKIICALVERKTSNSSMDLADPAGIVTGLAGLFKCSDVELRVAANRVLDGYHYVIRIQRKTTFNFTIGKLGFPLEVQEALYHTAAKRSGITLITGAIRTGKNTTAFALANEIVKDPVKIVSYESPIEVLMPFTQIDYQEDQDILANAVRLAKKQDVNIAFVNEIPNKEVAFAVQDLVNSSVHVITTTHMNRVWHLPYKLKEYYGVGFKDVLSQVNAVFNQKMFGVPCPMCQDHIMVDAIADKRFHKIFEKYGVHFVKTNHGCSHCNGTGLQPGVNQPYVEFIEFDDELVNKLLKCDSAYEMEMIIRDRVAQRNMETEIVHAIRDGKLPVSALNHII